MVTLTENAAKKVKEIFAGDPALSGKSLRVLVEKGGCSSYQYGFSFDEKNIGDSFMTTPKWEESDLLDSEIKNILAQDKDKFHVNIFTNKILFLFKPLKFCSFNCHQVLLVC